MQEWQQNLGFTTWRDLRCTFMRSVCNTTSRKWVHAAIPRLRLSRNGQCGASVHVGSTPAARASPPAGGLQVQDCKDAAPAATSHVKLPNSTFRANWHPCVSTRASRNPYSSSRARPGCQQPISGVFVKTWPGSCVFGAPLVSARCNRAAHAHPQPAR